MKIAPLLTLPLLGILLAAEPAAAQPANTPANAPAAKATPGAKPATTSKPAAPAKAEPGLPAAGGEQVQAASLAHVGDYACEFGEAVRVAMNPKHHGYIDVHHRKSSWTMKPVLSSTGALRLEDVRGRILMLQIANKSMLMDTKIGQRLVDNCVHDKQRDAMPHPPGQSLGIDPARAASAPS